MKEGSGVRGDASRLSIYKACLVEERSLEGRDDESTCYTVQLGFFFSPLLLPWLLGAGTNTYSYVKIHSNSDAQPGNL